uniref:Uncharacterized protein n=1 Tax=Anguilla anguilla TaxID=7936 RepID=A0A0E9VLT9_ANGAN
MYLSSPLIPFFCDLSSLSFIP